jgi:hypothetical protein
VKERDGSVTQVDIPLETGKSQFAVNLKLPDELLRGSNVLYVNNVRTNARQLAKVTTNASGCSFPLEQIQIYPETKDGPHCTGL